MDFKNFDEKIKSSLEHLEVPFDAGTWLALEKKMDLSIKIEQPANHVPLDGMMKNSLDSLDVTYQPADWNRLNTQLNIQGTLLRLRRSKIAEAAIFLLILANFQGFMGVFSDTQKPVKPVPAKSNIPMAAVHRTLPNRQAVGLQSDDQILDFTTTDTDDSGVLTTPYAINEEFSVGQFGVLSRFTDDREASLTTNEAAVGIENIAFNSALHPFAVLSKPQPAPFDWETIFDIIPGVSTQPTTKSKKLYVGAFAKLDQNRIHTPDFSTHTQQTGAGIAVAFRKNKWGVETGAAYTHHQFTPKKALVLYAGNPIDGFLGEYVQNVTATIVSVPLKATRRLVRFGKTSVHAVAGITANIAAVKHFAYKTEILPPLSQSGPSPQGPDPKKHPAPIHNIDGVLEGGSLTSNAYATADLGIRIEHPVGKRLVAFVEPAFSTALGNGYGPKRERVNAVSWQAGVFAAL